MKNSFTIVGVLAALGVGSFFTYQALKPLSGHELQKYILKRITQVYKQSDSKHTFLVRFAVQQEYEKQEQGYKFRIKVVVNQALKPTHSQNQQLSKNPFIPPFEPGQYVMDLDQDFTILLNKFPVHPLHVLLVTKKFVSQDSPQTPNLLFAAYNILKSMGGFAFFNSCREAGASLPHKHIQILPSEAFQSADVLNHIIEYYRDNLTITQQARLAKLRYMNRIKHYIYFYPSQFFQPQTPEVLIQDILYQSYLSLLAACGSTVSNVAQLKHNLIITSNFMMIVVRKSEKYRGIAVNAVGFTGSLLAKNGADFQILKTSKIIDVLEEISEIEETTHFDQLIWI